MRWNRSLVEIGCSPRCEGRVFGRGAGGLSSPRAIRGRRGGYQNILDREATPDDLAQLRGFVATRIGVEFYVEPETAATDTTAVAVAADGEWIRRRVGSPAVARQLAAELGIPAYDAAIVGYPDAMRRYRRPDSGH
ncbi:MAG TPA: oxidoreductase [Pseudonocardiaceae bacterium]